MQRNLLCIGDTSADSRHHALLTAPGFEHVGHARVGEFSPLRLSQLEAAVLLGEPAEIEASAKKIRELAPYLTLVAETAASAELDQLGVICCREPDALVAALRVALGASLRRGAIDQALFELPVAFCLHDKHERLLYSSPKTQAYGLELRPEEPALFEGARLPIEGPGMVRCTRREIALPMGQFQLEGHVDVTELDRCERQLLDVTRAESVAELARGVVHDLNNAFCVIASFADLLLESIDKGDERHEDVAEIARAGERASHLTGRLVAFSKARPGRLSPVNLVEAVLKMEPLFERAIGGGFRVAIELRCDSAVTLCDRSDLELVLVAMVLRARRIALRGSVISLTVEAGDGWAELGVRPVNAKEVDGVAPDADSFEDLALAVNRMGGKLEVGYPEIVVAVPRVDLELPGEVVPRAVQRADGTESVLVVEDESGLRLAMSRVLSALGYLVREVRRAEDAEPYVGACDLMIVDYALPEKNGLELIREVSARRGAPKTMLVTGYAELEIGDTSGVTVLRKPFTAAELARVVRAVLDGAAGPRAPRSAG